MKKLAVYLLAVVIFEPWSPRVYELIDQSAGYQTKCTMYFSDKSAYFHGAYNNRKISYFWKNYRLYVLTELKLAEIFNRDADIEKATDLKKEGLENKKFFDAIDNKRKELGIK